MALRRHLVSALILVMAAGAVVEAGESVGVFVAPIVGFSFMVWVLVSALLSTKHPSISRVSIIYWFLLFFPVSLIFFHGNIEAYLIIWYAYVAISFCVTLAMNRRLDPHARRFLLRWKGITLAVVTLLAVVAERDSVACVSRFAEYLHTFTAPEFVHMFGVVSCAVFALTFFGYYLTIRHSAG